MHHALSHLCILGMRNRQHSWLVFVSFNLRKYILILVMHSLDILKFCNSKIKLCYFLGDFLGYFD